MTASPQLEHSALSMNCSVQRTSLPKRSQIPFGFQPGSRFLAERISLDKCHILFIFGGGGGGGEIYFIYLFIFNFSLSLPPETLTAHVVREQHGLLPHGGTTCLAEGLPGCVPHLSLLPGHWVCPPVSQGKACNGAAGLSWGCWLVMRAVEWTLASLSLWPSAHDAAGWWITHLSG